MYFLAPLAFQRVAAMNETWDHGICYVLAEIPENLSPARKAKGGSNISTGHQKAMLKNKRGLCFGLK